MINQINGYNLVLICLIFLELLLILIPVYIISQISKISFKDALKKVGFNREEYNLKKVMMSIIEGFLLALLLFLIAGLLTLSSQYIFLILFGEQGFQEAVNSAIDVDPTNPNLLELIIFIILQFLIVAPSEEIFFRGIIFNKIKKKTNILTALAVSSSFFAFFHVPPIIVPFSTIFLYFGYFFTFGVFLSILYSFNKGILLPCIVTHAVFNMMILIT